MIEQSRPILIPRESKVFQEKHTTKKGKVVGGGYTHIYRIFRPWEFNKLIDVVSADEKELTNLKALLLLGCRYEEARRIQKDRSCYHDRKFVHVDEKKVKRVSKQREIRLSTRGIDIMPYFFNGALLPTVQAYDEKLKRWVLLAGLDPRGISVRCLRKTWESWLIYTYQNRTIDIVKSQGHTQTTAMEHYIGVSFTDDDLRDMRDWVSGWI